LGSTSVGFTGAPTLTQASTSTTSPGTTGLSNYSQDLQNEVNRELALAALPMQQVEDDVTTLTSQSTELNTLNSDFQALQSAIANVDSSNQGVLSASVSNESVLNANVSAGALAGTYTVDVTSAGSYSSAMSSDGLPTVSDPASQSISAASSFTLTVGSVVTTITPAANNLNALAAAINATPSAGVQATVVNVGPPTAPDYRLSLQSTTLGDGSIQLSDGTNLLSPLTTGADAKYQVNGSPATPILSDSSTVTLSPGVTVNLLSAGTSTVTVAPSTTAVSNALSSFVTAFNAAATEVTNNTGQNGGALVGQSEVYTLQQMLSSVGNYTTSSDGITSLASLGITFNDSGQLVYDPTVLAGASSSQIDSIESFLGGATTGGFLQFATNQLSAIEDPTTGILTNAISQTTASITSDNSLIAQQQAQLTVMQTSLQSQMASADSAIALLESQQSFDTTLFESMLLPSPEQLAQL
jgi:flagellar hook-associated protein 2